MAPKSAASSLPPTWRVGLTFQAEMAEAANHWEDMVVISEGLAAKGRRKEGEREGERDECQSWNRIMFL